MGWDGMGYNWRRAIFSDGRMGMGGWGWSIYKGLNCGIFS